MIVKGTRTEHCVQIEIEPIEIVKALYNYFKFEYGDFIEDNKVCYCVDEGHHTSYFKTYTKSEDPERVDVLKTLEVVKKLLDIKDYQMRY